MRSRMKSSQMLDSRAGSSITTIHSSFIGVNEIIRIDPEELEQAVSKQVQKYIDTKIQQNEILSEITTSENSGLKITDGSHIELDDVEFVIDCN